VFRTYIRNSFIRAIYSVAGIIGGNPRVESGLWFLMRCVKGSDLENAVLRDLLMIKEDDKKSAV
jgi:hypothetical protein